MVVYLSVYAQGHDTARRTDNQISDLGHCEAFGLLAGDFKDMVSDKQLVAHFSSSSFNQFYNPAIIKHE